MMSYRRFTLTLGFYGEKKHLYMPVSLNECARIFQREWESIKLYYDDRCLTVPLRFCAWNNRIELDSEELHRYLDVLIDTKKWDDNRIPQVMLCHRGDDEFEVVGRVF